MKYDVKLETEIPGLRISAMVVEPDEKPYLGIVQLVHGMSEYKERYLPFMEALAKSGYIAVIHDQRGHGKSVKDSSDLGFMYGSGAEGLIRDISEVNKRIHAKYSDLPIVLFGHSMGSLAVRGYTARYDDTIAALIVCGSPANNPGRGFAKMLARLEGFFRGTEHRSTLLTASAFGPYARRFKDEKSPFAWLTRDPEMLKKYEGDEESGFLFSDDAFVALFDLMKHAYDGNGYQCKRPELPVLFVSGEEDPCTVSPEIFKKTVEEFKSFGYKNVSSRLYKGMRHEILNELGREQVYADLIAWIAGNARPKSRVFDQSKQDDTLMRDLKADRDE